jgi:hypothetical protein
MAKKTSLVGVDPQFDKKLKTLLKPCKTKEELYNFITYFFDMKLPDFTVSRYADTNPFDIIWYIYNICVNGVNPKDENEILCVASRGAGKTLGMAIVELLVMLHDQRDVAHVGAILAQAKRCYEYQLKFLLSPKIRPLIEPKHLDENARVLQRMNMEKSVFKIKNQLVSLEVLPCTLKACVDPRSMVKTKKHGYTTIDTVNIGDKIASIDIVTGESVYREIKDVWIKFAPTFRLTLGNGHTIVGGEENKILTSKGWMTIRDVSMGSAITTAPNFTENCESNFKWELPSFSDKQLKSALVGMMLGDAHLASNLIKKKRMGNPRIYLAHSYKQFVYSLDKGTSIDLSIGHYSGGAPKAIYDGVYKKNSKKIKEVIYNTSGVVKKEYLGIRRLVDVEIEGETKTEHSFLINGMISSNCNGPHCSVIVVDEVDTVSGEGLKAFKEISGMVDSKGDKKALRVGISTRKSRYGLMNRQIENAEVEGRSVYKWTALEFSQRCPDSISGTDPVDVYTIQDKLECISQEEFNRKDPKKQKEYERHTLPGSGCARCPAASLCLGDAKKQQSKSPMLKPITDFIQKVRTEGADWAISQLMNLKPSIEGIVYKEFDEKIHVKTWNEMWLKLTGTEFPGECSHDVFVKKCFSADTEVVTKNGFKLFKDLTQYDEVATLDDSGKLIYEKPLDYICKPYKGDMVNIYNQIGAHGKQLDLLVTPDHQQTYVGNTWRKKGKFKIYKKETSKLPKGDFYIPSAPIESWCGPGYKSPISFMTDFQFMSYMGLWLSEGSANIGKNGQHFVTVCQKKEENINSIDEIMNQIEWPCKVYRSVDKRDGAISWIVSNKELYNYLSIYKLAVNKTIPRIILEEASETQLRELLKWLMLGDGSEYRNNPKMQPHYSTGSIKLANDVQELAFKLGYRTNRNITPYKRLESSVRKDSTERLPSYKIQIHSKIRRKTQNMWYIGNGTSMSGHAKKRGNNITTVSGYDDNVYCVTMPSGRLFVRRNGVIALSGNCHQLGLPSYAGADFGWSSPSTVVYFFVDKKDNVYVVRTDGMTYASNPEWVNYIKVKYQPIYRCQLYFPDVADPGTIVEMKKIGLPTASEVDKTINTGIQIIKKALRIPGTSDTKINIAKETCPHLINEFGLYHFKT